MSDGGGKSTLGSVPQAPPAGEPVFYRTVKAPDFHPANRISREIGFSNAATKAKLAS